MARTWRWTIALLLCGLGAVLGPVPTATAAPAADAGFGRVLADLGTAQLYAGQPGFSADGAYYAYLVAAGDRCDLRLYDVAARRPIALVHAHIVCGSYPRWAAQADTLVWQVNAPAGDITAYAWDADARQVSLLAPDAHVFTLAGVSADGRFLAFTGRSDTHPAPVVDAPRYADYVYDRSGAVSLPLSKPDLHVEFRAWGPAGHNFTADAGGRTPFDLKQGGCFGSGTSCRVFPSGDSLYYDVWSRDGTAVIGGPGGVLNVYDFSDGSLTPVPKPPGGGSVGYALFLGASADQVLAYLNPGEHSGGLVWDRRTGAVTQVSSPGAPEESPTGKYLLFHDPQPSNYRYLDVETGATALATYRGTDNHFVRDGFWTRDGSSYLGVGPGGCSSLRQWSPASNTVSLFGPPKARSCYYVQGSPEESSSASGRFAVVNERSPGDTSAGGEYLVDLRRHVLGGPLAGYVKSFAPAGADVLVFAQYAENRTERLLLVDPAPVSDVDDKPRWSAATPANGSRFTVVPGQQVQIELGASDQQQTPVNLYFRWRTAAGVPIASAPQGWSCDRRRLAAGATVASCVFAPTVRTDVRFLDVSATNFATGAQSDTRSYRLATG